MSTGICGLSASVEIAGSDQGNAYQWTLTSSSPEVDVTGFDSGVYGDFISCRRDGTIELKSHMRLGTIENGDYANIVLNTSIDTYACNNCLCTSFTVDAVATDKVDFTYAFRLTDDIV